MPLPFTPNADPNDVLPHLRRANPGRTVRFDDALPEPYYQSDRVTLYHGDALHIVPALDRSAIGAVVSDPPYGIGYKHGGGGRSPRGPHLAPPPRRPRPR